MKNVFFTILCAVATVFGVSAQESGITVSDVKIEGSGQTVNISFNAHVGRKATKAGYTLTATPVLVNGGQTIELQPIVVQRRKARVASKRNQTVPESNVIRAKNGETVAYQTSATTAGEILPGARLVMTAVSKGCCSERETAPLTLAENFVTRVPYEEEKVTYVEEPFVVPTTGDKLAHTQPFVLSAADFDVVRGISADQFVDSNRDNAITVYYRLGTNKLEPGFRNNGAALKELVATIKEIEESSDSRVVRVVVAGFASPEGSLELNNKLALGRAVAMRDYIRTNTTVDNNRINVHNGSADWRGLRDLVAASNMPEKARVLEIIDTVPVWDAKTQKGRLGELMRLNGGHTYRYLYDNLFPELRSAAYIRVYYENK